MTQYSQMLPDRTEILKERALRLELFRANPKMLEAAVLHYSKNFSDFINDWMMTYDPRLFPAELPFLLWPKQEEYIQWLFNLWQKKEDGLTEKSRDAGVTWLCAAFSVCLFLFYPGQAIAFGSRKEDLVDKIGDPKSIFEKIRFLLRNLPREFLPKNYDERRHAAFLKIMNPENGSTITGEAGDNIGRGGRSSIYFKDESAFYDRPDTIEAALSMNSDVKIDVSTPNGTGNPFYRKRMSGKVPVFTFYWKDDPRKDQAWYEKQCAKLDPVIVAQEIDIDYNASVSNSLIDGEFVKRAMLQRATFAPIGPKVLGVDPARFGSDRTAYVMRQGRVVHWIDTDKKKSTTEIVGRINHWMRHYWFDMVFVDVIGLGAGIFDQLQEQWGERIISVQSSESARDVVQFKNKRIEMWCDMRDWFKDPNVCVPFHDDLMVDLTAPQYFFSSSGQMQLEKKEDMRKRGVKSPDIGDALALTFAEEHERYSPEFDHETATMESGAGGY